MDSKEQVNVEAGENGRTLESKSFPVGFSSFADFVSTDPELFIFRKFKRIAARNILYLQSELQYLSAELDRFDAEDFELERKNEKPCLTAQCWEIMVEEAEDGKGERMKVVKRMRKALKEYQEAVLLQKQMLKLENPSKRALEVFQGWLDETRPLVGLDLDIIAEGKDDDDLAALAPPERQDPLSTALQNHCGYFMTKSSRDAPGKGIIYFSELRIKRVVTTISTATAAMLLVGAITCLNYVKAAGARLGLIGCFTTLFAASVGLLTNARRAEIFGATAAYAAVLVVFVSGNLESGATKSQLPLTPQIL